MRIATTWLGELLNKIYSVITDNCLIYTYQGKAYFIHTKTDRDSYIQHYYCPAIKYGRTYNILIWDTPKSHWDFLMKLQQEINNVTNDYNIP